MMDRAVERGARIGVFAVGHSTYWAQFEGLLPNLMGFHEDFKKILAKNEVEIIDFGMVDDSKKAYRVADEMKGARLDLIICNMVTYATSSTFAPIIMAGAAPVILAALQPRAGLDYTRASIFMQLENDNICSVPEFTGVANRLGKRVYDVIIGELYEDEKAEGELALWCDIAKVLHGLRGARIGLMGHVMEAMYDMHTDPVEISRAFGVHVPLFEICDLMKCHSEVTDAEILEKTRFIEGAFDMPDPVGDPVTKKLTKEDLKSAAWGAAALDRFVKEHDLTGLAYYYEGAEGSAERAVSASLIVGNSILNARGIPMCGEFDLKTCLAMLIMDRLDIGGSFAELHPFDFREDFILIGHDGPHHLKIAEGKPILRSLVKYHGKPGSGASVEFKLREGPITMLGITHAQNGRLKFIIGEGYSKKGPIPPTGNTNTRGFFEPDTKSFIKAWVMEGPTHHYALGIKHRADALVKIAEVLGIEHTVVKV